MRTTFAGFTNFFYPMESLWLLHKSWSHFGKFGVVEHLQNAQGWDYPVMGARFDITGRHLFVEDSVKGCHFEYMTEGHRKILHIIIYDIWRKTADQRCLHSKWQLWAQMQIGQWNLFVLYLKPRWILSVSNFHFGKHVHTKSTNYLLATKCQSHKKLNTFSSCLCFDTLQKLSSEAGQLHFWHLTRVNKIW